MKWEGSPFLESLFPKCLDLLVVGLEELIQRGLLRLPRSVEDRRGLVLPGGEPAPYELVKEPGVSGVMVNLYSGAAQVDGTMTDGNGLYQFPGLTPGDYFVEFVLPSGFVFTGLSPRQETAGLSIVLADVGGESLLRYSGLAAWDATGQVLPARVSVSADSILIRVQEDGTHESVIRFAPPLVIEREDIDWALTQVREVLT